MNKVLDIPKIKFTNYTDIREFGAIGDGIADDSNSLLNSILSNIGGTVFLPKGTYLINTNFELNKDITIKGEIGTKIILKDFSFRIRNCDAKFDNIEFLLNDNYLMIQPFNNEITMTDYRYYSNIYQNAIFENCKFSNTTYKHILVNFSNYIHFINCEFFQTGVNPSNVGEFLIDKCSFDAKFQNLNNDEILAIGVYVYGSLTNSFLKNSVSDMVDIYQCKKFIIDGCLFDGCNTSFIEVKAGYRDIVDPYYFTATNCTGVPELIVIKNNIFKNVKNPTNIKTPKFFISGGFEDYTLGGIDLTPFYRNSILIENNLFDDSFLDGVNELPTYVCAVFVSGMNGLRIQNNVFKPQINAVFLKSYSVQKTSHVNLSCNIVEAYNQTIVTTLYNAANSNNLNIKSNHVVGKGLIFQTSALGANSGCQNVNLDGNIIDTPDSNGVIQLSSGTTGNKLKIFNSIVNKMLVYSTLDEIEFYNCSIAGVVNIRPNVTTSGILSLLSFNNCSFNINGLNINLYGDGTKTISKLILVGCKFNSGAYILNNATITEYYQNGNVATSTPGYIFSGTKPVYINNETYF